MRYMEIYALPKIKIKEVMTTNIIAVEKGETIESIVKKFIKYDFHGFPVVDKGGLIGIVTKTDLLKIIGDKKLSNIFASHVEDIMTPHPITISPELYILDSAKLMHKNRIRLLPVVENEKMVGLLSYSDIIRKIFKE